MLGDQSFNTDMCIYIYIHIPCKDSHHSRKKDDIGWPYHFDNDTYITLCRYSPGIIIPVSMHQPQAFIQAYEASAKEGHMRLVAIPGVRCPSMEMFDMI